MHKKILLSAAALAIVGTTLVTAQQAFAQTSNQLSNPMSLLVEKISTKFGLNQSEVQAVFDEVRQTHQKEMLANAAVELAQLVSDGKITEEQKQLIIAKRQELQNKHQSLHEFLQSKTAVERQAAMEANRKALEAWAAENGIDLQYLMPHGQKGLGMHGFKPDFADTTTTTPTE